MRNSRGRLLSADGMTGTIQVVPSRSQANPQSGIFRLKASLRAIVAAKNHHILF
jgi:hypothetical protein